MYDDEGGDDEQQCSLIQRYYSWADYGLGAEAWPVCTCKFSHHTSTNRYKQNSLVSDETDS